MKRLLIAVWCIALVSFFAPEVVFGGGKGDKGDSGPKNTAEDPVPAPGSPSGTPAETSLQDTQVAATIQIAPGVAKETIFRGQLKAEVERMEQSARRSLSTEERRQVLDVMINERLAVQAAKRDNVTVSDSEINQQLQQMRTNMAQAIGHPPTDAEFAQALKSETGLTEEAFKEQVRRQMIVQRYLTSKKENLFKTLAVPSEQEIRDAFNLARSQFVRPETVRFSMVQVPYGADAAAKTKAKELADRLVREIGSNPSRFDDVVSRGRAPGSGYQAGDGGYLPKNLEAQRIVGQDFINTAFSLRQGQVSKLIEGIPGYQIVKITENYAEKRLELDDVLQLGTNLTVRTYIGNTMLQERQQKILDQASQELVTELRAGGKTYQVFESNLTW
jgi:parvulin-like peptidyl-prolyl isomerase